jgi:hypothetical protein
MPLRQIVLMSITSGTVAALAMMPFGFAFRTLGLRVGHYGPKFASLFIADPGPLILFIQHVVLGWVSAMPLVGLLLLRHNRLAPAVLGAIYGAGYYITVNSLALPLYFGDTLPWKLGVATVVPSLVVHIVFGAVVAMMCSRATPVRHDT